MERAAGMTKAAPSPMTARPTMRPDGWLTKALRPDAVPKMDSPGLFE